MEDHRSRIPVRAYVSVVIFLERKVMSNKSLETIGYYNILEKLMYINIERIHLRLSEIIKNLGGINNE